MTIGNDGLLYITSGDDDNYVEGSDGSRAAVLRTGGVFRCRPDGSKMEVFSIGYRNPYRDVVYDRNYNWFHVDNDNEDGSKFTGCRLMHVAEESDFGWRLFQGARCCRPDPIRSAVFGELPGKMPPMFKTGRGAPAGLLIYNDTQLPTFYRGWLYYPDVFRKLIRAYQVEPTGSTFKAVREFEFLTSNDPLFRPCQMITGPDGAIYIADWRTDSGGAGRLFGDGRHGRIYRITWTGAAVPGEDDAVPAIERRMMDSWSEVAKQADDRLLALLGSEDATIRDRARIEIVQRGDKNRARLLDLIRESEAVGAARMAALGAVQSMWNDDVKKCLLETILDADPDIRRIAIDGLASRCTAGDSDVHAALLKIMGDPNLAVRRAIVLAIGKINADNAPEVLVEAYKFDDGKCTYLTDGIVRAIERTGKRGIAQLLAMARSGKDGDRDKVVAAFLTLRTRAGAAALPELLSDPHLSLEQRVALIKSYTNYLFDPPISLDALTDFLLMHTDMPIEAQVAALEVLAETGNLKGAKVANVLTTYLDSPESAIRLRAIKAIENGKVDQAGPRLVQALGDDKRSSDERAAMIKALRPLKGQSSVGVLKEIFSAANPASLKLEALRSLAIQDPGATHAFALKLLESSDRSVQNEALQILGTRLEGAKLIGQRFIDKKLPTELLPQVSEVLRRHSERNPELKQMLTEVMKGGLLLTNQPGEIEKIRQLVKTKGNAQRGKAIYLNSKQLACVNCHQLEGLGGQVGPDLSKIWETGSIEKIMESIIEPSKEIKEGFQSFKVTLKNGQTFTGLKVIDKPTELAIRDANGKDIALAREDVEEVAASKSSLMPDNVVSQLSFDQFIDLVAFLKSREAQESLRGVVKEFWVAGPFGNNLQKEYGPEKQTAPGQKFLDDSTPARTIEWARCSTETNGFLNLHSALNKENASAYALTYVYSPKAQKADLFVGADHSLRVWVNDRRVHENDSKRHAVPDQDRIGVTLNEGWNTIVVKVVGNQEHGLYLRLRGEGLKSSLSKKPD